MPQTRQNGAIVPVGSDPYALTQDLPKLTDSLNVVIKIASTAARDALTPTAGMMVVRTDLGGLVQTYVDGAWKTNYGGPYRWWNAITTFTLNNVSGDTRAITFPSGLFTQPPLIQLTKQTDAGAKYIPYVMAVTTAGCTVGLFTGDGTASTGTVPVAIHAIQATTTTAAGQL